MVEIIGETAGPPLTAVRQIERCRSGRQVFVVPTVEQAHNPYGVPSERPVVIDLELVIIGPVRRIAGNLITHRRLILDDVVAVFSRFRIRAEILLRLGLFVASHFIVIIVVVRETALNGQSRRNQGTEIPFGPERTLRRGAELFRETAVGNQYIRVVPFIRGASGSERPIGIANRARNGRILLQRHENIIGRSSRIGTILNNLSEPQFNGKVLRQIDIDIRPEIIALGPRVGIIAERRILLEQTALRREPDIDIIADGLVSAGNRQIVHRLERILLQDGIRPIHIRVKIRIRSILELLKGNVVPRKSHSAYRAGLVHQRSELIAVHIVRETEAMQLGSLHTQRNLGPSHLPLLRIDENNAIGSPRTVNGRSRRILQDGERFDLRRIYQIQIAFNTIDQNQRIGIPPGSHASNIENGSIITRFAAGLTGDDTRHRAAERIGQRHGGYFGQLLGLYKGE